MLTSMVKCQFDFHSIELPSLFCFSFLFILGSPMQYLGDLEGPPAILG